MLVENGPFVATGMLGGKSEHVPTLIRMGLLLKAVSSKRTHPTVQLQWKELRSVYQGLQLQPQTILTATMNWVHFCWKVKLGAARIFATRG